MTEIEEILSRLSLHLRCMMRKILKGQNTQFYRDGVKREIRNVFRLTTNFTKKHLFGLVV